MDDFRNVVLRNEKVQAVSFAGTLLALNPNRLIDMRNDILVDANSSRAITLLDVVQPFNCIPTDRPAIPLCRVSTEFQSRIGNLDDQEQNIKRWLKDKGITALAAVKHVGKGNDIEWLVEGVTRAIETDATLIGESLCRIMRPQEFYDTGNIFAELLPKELQKLHDVLRGVPTFTLIYPNAALSEIRSEQIKRGITLKNATHHKTQQGIGFRKRRREAMMEEALQAITNHLTTRETAAFLSTRHGMKISHVTISNWIREHTQKRNNSN